MREEAELVELLGLQKKARGPSPSAGRWGQPTLKHGKSSLFAKPTVCDELNMLLCPVELAEWAFLQWVSRSIL